MSAIPRRAARRDINEPGIIRVFEEAGCVVQQLSAKGVPDLLVMFLGVSHLVEVKRDNEPLTEDQEKWHKAASVAGVRPLIVRSEAHARKAVAMWTLEFAVQSKLEALHLEDIREERERVEALWRKEIAK